MDGNRGVIYYFPHEKNRLPMNGQAAVFIEFGHYKNLLTFQTDRSKKTLMGRPKAYKRDKVLDDAMQLFWQKGYHGTSLSELVAATGLNKHSMYKEFGSKAGLFDECIAHYWRKIVRELLDILAEEPLGLSNIRAFFENRIEYICSDDFKSCLFVKSTLEKDLLEANALEQIQRRNKIYEKAFISCLEAAVRSGELPPKADPEFLTRYLLHFLSGMLVMGKPEKGKAEAERLMDFVMSSISMV